MVEPTEPTDLVQQASDRVWNTILQAGTGVPAAPVEHGCKGAPSVVGYDWYKATISITAHTTKAWTARAVKPDGSLGTEFPFTPTTNPT